MLFFACFGGLKHQLKLCGFICGPLSTIALCNETLVIV